MELLPFCSSLETEGEAAKTGAEPGQSQTSSNTAEEADSVGRPASTSGTVSTVLATAGNTLEGTQAELVLNPLRLAFDTKNLKVLEPALDCLHVCIVTFWCFVNVFLFSIIFF